MAVLNEVLVKLQYFLRTHVQTLSRFDMFLQFSFLTLVLLQSNVILLLRRDHGGEHTAAVFEDWVLIGAAGVECLAGALIGWWGGRKRNFALTAWLGLAAVSGLLVLFVPFSEPEERRQPVELCGGEHIPYRDASSDDIRKSARLVFLIISAIACSLARLSIWVHGFSYLDDHDPKSGPNIYGNLTTIRLTLGLSGQRLLRPSSLGEDWWKIHLSICCVLLFFSVLFALFPTQMKEFSDDEQDRDKTISRSFIPSLGRVVRNKAVVMQTVAISLLTTAVFGFVHYDRSFVQARFHIESNRQDPRSSRALSEYYREIVIIIFVMIFRVRFSGRRCHTFKTNTAAKVGGVVAVIVAILLAIIAARGCDVGDIEGVGDEYVQPACSMQCGCDSARYGFSPVCGLETATTYFSPCHAGCQEVRDLNGFPLFLNCTCGGVQAATRGACSLDNCRSVFSMYQVLCTVFQALAGASFLMQGLVVVRAVRRADKPIAMAASFAGTALLASVLGHLIYMIFSYITCAFESEGRCVLHKGSIWIIACTSSVLALCSGVISIIVSRSLAQPARTLPTTEQLTPNT